MHPPSHLPSDAPSPPASRRWDLPGNSSWILDQNELSWFNPLNPSLILEPNGIKTLDNTMQWIWYFHRIFLHHISIYWIHSRLASFMLKKVIFCPLEKWHACVCLEIGKYKFNLWQLCLANGNYIWAHVDFLGENRAHTYQPTFHLTRHPLAVGSNPTSRNDFVLLYIHLRRGSRY